jgi:hypothetical protein
MRVLATKPEVPIAKRKSRGSDESRLSGNAWMNRCYAATLVVPCIAGFSGSHT